MRQGIAFAATALLLAGLLGACRRDRPEDLVRAAFEGCRTAVEAGDAAAATAPLDAAFQGPDGMDKGSARLYLMGLFRQEKVGVTVLRDDLVVRDPEAFQEVELLLTSRGGGLLPQDAGRRSFRLRWRHTGGAWKLVALQSLDGG